MNSSVYLGDLAENVTEELIFDVFAQAGSIQSIRLCKDATTRKPLGYAYVNYASAADASKALEKLNHTLICGKPVRLMPSQRDPSARRSGVGNLFAKNLDPEKVTNKVLHDTFNKFGRVLSAKVATDASGNSKGYGFIQFEDPKAAEQAIQELNLQDLCGQQLFVGPFIPAKDRAVEPGKFCNVYVRNLGSEVDEDLLHNVFGEYGAITSTVVMRNSNGKSRGFGFVNFGNTDHAARAVTEMDGYRHNGLKWRVSRAQKRSDYELDASQKQQHLVRSSLYLRNLDPKCSDEDLRQLFEEFGGVDHAKVLKDASGKSKGVGFVQFSEPEDAEAAITGMNGKTLGSSPKPLFVTLAQRKQQKAPAEELPASFTQRSLSTGVAPLMPGLMPPMPFFPPGPQFFYQPLIPPGAGMMAPGFLGAPSLMDQAIFDRSGSLISLPSGHYPGMPSSLSTPVPGVGRGRSGPLSMASRQLVGGQGDSWASTPLPLHSGHLGILPEGHHRGRIPHHPHYTPQGALQPYVSARGGQVSRVSQASKPALTSPFSAVQAGPSGRAMQGGPPSPARAQRSKNLASPATSVASQPSAALPKAGSSTLAGGASAARQRSEQRRALYEQVRRKTDRWKDEVTQMLLEDVSPRAVTRLLADQEELVAKIAACVVALEVAEPAAATPCSQEDAEPEAAQRPALPVPAA